jgi:tetratricopeptide (TPR) repeat protein
MRLRTLFILVLLFLVTGAAGVYFVGAAHLRAAQAAFDGHDLERAQAELDKCLTLWPRSYRAHLLAARTARRLYHYDAAQKHLDACENLEGRTDPVTLEAVLADVQRGRLSGTEQTLQRLMADHSPEAPLIMEALAVGYSKELQFPKAQHVLDELIQQQPGNRQALMLRGLVGELQKRAEDAARDYERVLELDPQWDEARLGLADSFRESGRIREATAQYECLQQRRPENMFVILGLVQCLQASAELERAQQLLERLLTRDPTNVSALVERGRIAIRQGDLEEAETWLRKAVHYGPVILEAQQMLYVCLDAEHKRPEADNVLKAVKRLETDNARINRLTSKIQDDPRNYSVRTEIGMLLLGVGREDEGVRWLNGVLQEDPKNVPAQRALAGYSLSRSASLHGQKGP